MIADWRAKWAAMTDGRTSSQFPFGFVQLNSIGNNSVYDSPTDPGDDLSPVFGYAALRWSQTASYGFVPNPAQPRVFMAVSYDTPDRPSTEPEPVRTLARARMVERLCDLPCGVGLCCAETSAGACACCCARAVIALRLAFCWIQRAQPIQATDRRSLGPSWAEHRLQH